MSKRRWGWLVAFAMASFAAVGACSGDEPRLPSSESDPGALTCIPGELRACYGGPKGTEGVGRCAAGQQVCHQSGLGFGLCEGERRPEPESCATEADENCDGLTTCAETIFSTRFGSGRDDTVTQIALHDGHVYLQGHYRDPFDLGDTTLEVQNGSRDVYVTEMTDTGDTVWARGFHATTHLSPAGLAVASDGRVGLAIRAVGEVHSAGIDPVGGAGGSDVMLVMLDPSGAIQWTLRMGDDEAQRPAALAFLPDGALVVTGSAAGTIDFGDGPRAAHEEAEEDVFLAVYEPDGQLRFAELFAGPAQQRARGLAVQDDGTIAVVGEVAGEVDFGGGPLLSAGDRDAFLAVLDSDGSHRFSRIWGDPSEDRAHAVAFDAAGGVVVAGRFEGDLRVGPRLHHASGGAAFVIKLSATGDLLWSRAYGGADAGAYGLAIDSRDRAVVSGYYEDDLEFGNSELPAGGVNEPQIMVLKIEPNGDPVWARGIGVRGEQSVSDAFVAQRVVAVDDDDRIHLAGFVEGPIDFGDGVEHEDFGRADAFVWILAP